MIPQTLLAATAWETDAGHALLIKERTDVNGVIATWLLELPTSYACLTLEDDPRHGPTIEMCELASDPKPVSNRPGRWRLRIPPAATVRLPGASHEQALALMSLAALAVVNGELSVRRQSDTEWLRALALASAQG